MSLSTRNTLAAALLYLSIFTGAANAQASTESRNWDLAGTWKLNVGYFNLRSDGDCTVRTPTGASGATVEAPMPIRRTASGYSVRVNVPAEIQVSGNRATFVEQVQYGRLRWEGTLSREVDIDKARVITEFSGTETCNSQATLPFTFRREQKPVYNYIYINGINTPRGQANDPRGSCLSERRMIQEVLIDRTRLRDETNTLLDTDCNATGINTPFTTLPNFITNGIAVSGGDLLQAFLQNIASSAAAVNGDALSGSIVSRMRAIMEQEKNSQNNEINYFVIVAHSQGNFFAEKVGGELGWSSSEDDKKLLKRLRIIAIASPTNYAYSSHYSGSRGRVDSTRVNVQPFTRCDDIILSLSRFQPVSNPFPGNLEPPLSGQCGAPDINSDDPRRDLSLRAHFLDEYFNSLPIVERMTEYVVTMKKDLLQED